jgi:hypothetical protein
LRQQLAASVVTDAVRITRDIEQAYRDIWRLTA